MNEKTTELQDNDQQEDKFPSGFIVEDISVEDLLARVAKLERRNRVVMFTFFTQKKVATMAMYHSLVRI